MSIRNRRGDQGGRRGSNALRKPVVVTPVSGDTTDLGAISQLNLSFRGVNRNNISPTANSDLAYQVQRVMTNNPAFKVGGFSE